MGFSAETVDERVRPYCLFPHRTRPPERISLSAAHSRGTQPAFKRHFSLPGTLPPALLRVVLSLARDEDNLGGSLAGLFQPREWCLNDGRRPTSRNHEGHHWTPARCRLLRVALTARETKLRPPQEKWILRKMQIGYLLLFRVPRLEVVVWIIGWCSPAQGNRKMTDVGMALTKQPPLPSAAWNRSRPQHLYTVGRPVSLVLRRCQPLNRRSSARKKPEDTSSGCMPAILRSGCRDPRHHTSWLWAKDGPHAGRLCRWVGPLAPVESMRENRLPRKKEGVPVDSSLYFFTKCQE